MHVQLFHGTRAEGITGSDENTKVVLHQPRAHLGERSGLANSVNPHKDHTVGTTTCIGSTCITQDVDVAFGCQNSGQRLFECLTNHGCNTGKRTQLLANQRIRDRVAQLISNTTGNILGHQMILELGHHIFEVILDQHTIGKHRKVLGEEATASLRFFFRCLSLENITHFKSSRKIIIFSIANGTEIIQVEFTNFGSTQARDI
mmetsp:Transcript_8876/g.22321  ORF Transcript_8876/g.22321 Transcript_8876/m.22321 type:complete len:203 (-) Transcript_8876:999-1607(-)